MKLYTARISKRLAVKLKSIGMPMFRVTPETDSPDITFSCDVEHTDFWGQVYVIKRTYTCPTYAEAFDWIMDKTEENVAIICNDKDEYFANLGNHYVTSGSWIDAAEQLIDMYIRTSESHNRLPSD